MNLLAWTYNYRKGKGLQILWANSVESLEDSRGYKNIEDGTLWTASGNSK